MTRDTHWITSCYSTSLQCIVTVTITIIMSGSGNMTDGFVFSWTDQVENKKAGGRVARSKLHILWPHEVETGHANGKRLLYLMDIQVCHYCYFLTVGIDWK